ncbi:MAG: DUF4249 family protein [Bacteroidota bacterium]|nr:DUF4249 family protein [Bacteroidota bacterium]
MRNLILITGICIFLTACQKEQVVNYVIPQKQKLFAACFIGDSDSITSVYLTRTTPVIGSENIDKVLIKDASVQISTFNQTIGLPYDDNLQVYSTQANTLIIKPGIAYTLKVNAGNESVSGTTVVPVPAAVVLNTKIDSTLIAGDLFNTYRIETTCLQTSAGRYPIRLAAIMVFEDSGKVELTAEETNLLFEMEQNSSKTVHFTQFGYDIFSKPVRLEIIALTTDEAYYKYHQNIEKYKLNFFIPFGEPFFIYSNMSNKIGITGSYSTSHVTMYPL